MFFRRTECCNFVHNSTPYIHPRFDSRNWPSSSECDCDCHKPHILKMTYSQVIFVLFCFLPFLTYYPETEETAVGSSLARVAGGQVVYLGDLPFSPHLAIDSAQNE